MSRLTTKQREQLYDREVEKARVAGRGDYPICALCDLPIAPSQRWHDNHDKYLPRALNGRRDGISHERCNLLHARTVAVPQIAKAKRQRQKHIGAHRSASRPIPDTRIAGIRDQAKNERSGGEMVTSRTFLAALVASALTSATAMHAWHQIQADTPSSTWAWIYYSTDAKGLIAGIKASGEMVLSDRYDRMTEARKLLAVARMLRDTGLVPDCHETGYTEIPRGWRQIYPGSANPPPPISAQRIRLLLETDNQQQFPDDRTGGTSSALSRDPNKSGHQK